MKDFNLSPLDVDNQKNHVREALVWNIGELNSIREGGAIELLLVVLLVVVQVVVLHQALVQVVRTKIREFHPTV